MTNMESTTINPPTPEEIRKARGERSQEDCAALIYKKRAAWSRWESGSREMDPALFELFLIKSK